MSFNPCRRGARGGAGVRARQKAADLHEGSRQDFLRRHEREAEAAARGPAATKKAFVAKLLQRAVDTRNLRLAWDYLAAKGGQSPGVDRLRFDDLQDQEV